ncbi:PhoX family phosphatase [Nocardioides humilatus]|uniref:PhoX family phosphatase n=1 Tax=Nocardioides humilatus TaxID=2607660 RepID=A0A5B1LD57_9ACTN|nr:PhoX family phosphatase [Nocardioides humilatus]KAA1417730.1 PhoX family phosphatase [Nocardioides humilatus]
MTATRPENRPLLSLTPVSPEGYRHGSRSLLTCLYKCGNACDHPEPNQTATGHVQDEISKAIARRSVLRGAAAGTGALMLGGVAAASAASPAAAAPGTLAAAAVKGGPLARTKFRSVAPNRRDAVVLPDGFDHNVVISWGDPVVEGAPAWSPYDLTLDAVKKTFGYNNDYVSVVPLSGDAALMTVNHEYDDQTLMYPTGAYTEEQMAWFGIYSHGLSVVQIKRGLVPGSWYREKNLAKATKNRRINADTTFRATGPAAGHPLLQTAADPSGTAIKGTLNNCSGGTTPWGTVLSGEENFNQYFNTEGTVPTGVTLDDGSTLTNAYTRYGIAKSGSDPRKWHKYDDRFDLEAEAHEVHRFGWIVEIDPMKPEQAPRKHTMLGRFKHEGACAVISGDKRAVVYMGDDERGDYLYKFVSADKYDERASAAARRHNKTLLTKGTLFVAKVTGNDVGTPTAPYDGTGEWLPLTSDTQSFVPGMTVAEVLVFTRQAADLVGPTKMDRPEDVEVNKVNGKVYAALTNNSNRGSTFPADEANPVTSCGTRTSPGAPLVTQSGNRNGYVLEITPGSDNHARRTFTWDLFLVCGDPDSPETYFAGYDKSKVSRISCPDNVTFDAAGNLWIATDGAPTPLGQNDGLFRVPTAGAERGHVQCFLTVPKGAETCGPLMYDGDKSLFFAPQHPGEISGAVFESPLSTWPNTHDFPRPSVCVAYQAR